MSTNQHPHTDADDLAAAERAGEEGFPPMTSGDRMFMVLLTLFEIGASILVLQLVKQHGGSDFAAYMWANVPPAIGAVVWFVRTREVSGASVAILAFNLIGALIALVGSHDSKVLLYKDCFATGIIGLVFLGSILVRRPVTYYYGERFWAGSSAERRAIWRGLWRYRGFRVGQYQTCVLWAVVMFVEAGAKAWVVHRSSFATAYLWDQVLPLVATAIGIVGTLWLARRSQRSGERARAARRSATA